MFIMIQKYIITRYIISKLDDVKLKNSIDKLDQDINPDINNTYNLGSSNKSWLNLWAKDAHISNIELKNSQLLKVKPAKAKPESKLF